MKRKEVSIENAPFVWREAHVMQVFKIVAMYGFTNMQDIGMFVSVTKAFTLWAEANIFMSCACVVFCKDVDRKFVPAFQVYNRFLPRPALLKTHKAITVFTLDFVEPRFFYQIEEFNFTALKNDQSLMAVRFGRESDVYLTLDFVKPSFIKTIVEKDCTEDDRIKQINIIATLAKV